MSGKRNQRQRTWIFTELREPSPCRPSTCERPPTTRPRRSREASGRINLSVATRGKERGQASKTQGLPPSTWWASPSLVAGGVSSACLLPSATLQGSPRANPKTRGRGDGERGRGPRGRRGGEHQLYGNEGLAPPPALPLTWVQLLLQRPPSISPNPVASSPLLRPVAPVGQGGTLQVPELAQATGESR